ncbi:MAG: NADH-quinone oxidoreductase subunit J [Burkholderiales bacterium]
MIESALLYFFAAASVASALWMLFARHPMRVALALIVSMVSLAGIYALLGVHAIAVFQVLIYVGAVMVFMVYVIMLIDTRDRSFSRFGRFALPGGLGLVALAFVFGYALSGVEAPAAADAGRGFGIQGFSEAFLNEYWLYFELISVLLVAAVVAAVAVVKIGGTRRG